MTKPLGNILIVDDTPENIQVLGGMLRDGGYSINVATGGQQALTSIGRVVPDLLLLDVIMPEMDGFEVCRRLKANEETEDIPVIFLTAKIETEDIVRGFELGAVDYVTKPFNSAELLRRVNTHVTLSRLRKELGQRVEDLSGALACIEQLHREQDSFLRHELSNAINPIAGYAEMLRMQLGGSSDEKVLGWTGSILKSTASMKMMLTQMKKLQDIEQGAQNLALARIPIGPVLNDVIESVRVMFNDQVGISLEPETPAQIILADITFLPGVFKNLIKNAAEHVLLLSDEDRCVSMTCASHEGMVHITVHNGGDPIEPERLKTFFDKFNSMKASEGGTGLGTSYARIVTLAHGGTICAVSSRENGTLVTVSLPLVD